MKTGAKIALGCAGVVVLGGIAVTVLIGGAAWFAKTKLEEVAGDLDKAQKEVAAYEQQANANPFTEPADGVIQEPRLVKYLNVRRGVYDVYMKYKPELERLDQAQKEKRQATLSEVGSGIGTIVRMTHDIKLAQYKGLAAEGMNDAEYLWLTTAVYKTAAMKGSYDETGKQAGEQLSEGMAEMRKQFREGVQKAAEAAREVDSSAPAPPTEEQVAEAEAAFDELGRKAETLNVPRENLALFKKYEADIQKYTMHSLAMIGL
jgi:hypothetical protein